MAAALLVQGSFPSASHPGEYAVQGCDAWGVRICAHIAQKASVQHVTLHSLQNPTCLALENHEFDLSEVAAAAADDANVRPTYENPMPAI